MGVHAWQRTVALQRRRKCVVNVTACAARCKLFCLSQEVKTQPWNFFVFHASLLGTSCCVGPESLRAAASAGQWCSCVGYCLMTLACFGAGNEEGLSQVGIYTETEVTNADTAAGLVTPPPTAQDKLSPQGPTTRSKSARKVSCGRVLAAFSFCRKRSRCQHTCALCNVCAGSCISCSGQVH